MRNRVLDQDLSADTYSKRANDGSENKNISRLGEGEVNTFSLYITLISDERENESWSE